MNRRWIALLVAVVACGACASGSAGAVVSRSGEPVLNPAASGTTASSAPSAAPKRSPVADPSPSAASGGSHGCPVVRAGQLDRVVARAIDGLRTTTAADAWSRACAQVLPPDGSGDPHTLIVRIGWMGTLQEYASRPGAVPIDGLADEAYTLDDGAVALRKGELVAVVRWSGETASDTLALARLVAEQLEPEA